MVFLYYQRPPAVAQKFTPDRLRNISVILGWVVVRVLKIVVVY